MTKRAIVLGSFPLLSACELSLEGGTALGSITLSVGGLVSIAAMLLYYKYRLEGEPSRFKRFATFMAGMPVTLFIMCTVDEDPERVFRRIDQDDDAYDLDHLESELAAFRAYKRSLQPSAPKAPSAPRVPPGLASNAQEAEPTPRKDG